MSGVKAGIMLTNQQREGTDMVSALEEQIVMVRIARDRGWDSFFSGQHYLNEGGSLGNRRLRVQATAFRPSRATRALSCSSPRNVD